MLEFPLEQYLTLFHRAGMVLGQFRVASGRPVEQNVLGDSLNNILAEAIRLDLPVTKELMLELFEELAKENLGKVTIDPDRTIHIRDAHLTTDRVLHHAESLVTALRTELSSIVFKAIPREKARYSKDDWLAASPLAKYPEMLAEIQRAGRCYAYGENTAAVFHLMRVVDFCLRKVAEAPAIGVAYDARCWMGISDAITKKMEQKYKDKTDDWKKEEPFYASVLTDIQAISRAHRNPVLHELEKKYDEREARHMLDIVDSFAVHVTEKL